jgi:DNA-binding CsgD family transcriptional regulator
MCVNVVSNNLRLLLLEDFMDTIGVPTPEELEDLWNKGTDEEKEKFYRINLTFRERQILSGVARGLVNKEIAGELGISPHTVSNLLKKAMQRNGCETRTELVVLQLLGRVPSREEADSLVGL